MYVFYLFIYDLLVFTAMKLSLVVASGASLYYGVWASHCSGSLLVHSLVVLCTLGLAWCTLRHVGSS